MHVLPSIFEHASSAREKRVIRLRLQQGIYWIEWWGMGMHRLYARQVQDRGWISWLHRVSWWKVFWSNRLVDKLVCVLHKCDVLEQ
jgi:hypothetical protein